MSNQARQVVVANVSSPELNHLCVELDAREALKGYVRRYCNKDRAWERGLAATPLIGKLYERTLGRRRVPRGLDPHRIVEQAVASDFLFALAGRSKFIGSLVDRDQIMRRIEAEIGLKAERMLGESDIFVGAYYAALPSIRRARALGVRSFLNYPIAHHRYQREFYAEEAAWCPEFAGMLPNLDMSPDMEAFLDEEIASADTILVGSTFVKNSFVHAGIDGARIRTIPYGVDPGRFAPREAPRTPGDFRVIFAGSVGQRKGIGYLLKGYQQFRKPDSSLTIVGSIGGDTAALRPYEHLARFIPNVPQLELAELYRSSDVFLFPTLMEGLPLVVIEAMGSGLPVIVTDRGPGDLVRDGIEGFVVPIRDPEAIAACLERLYRDPDLRAQMGQAARARAETFSWPRYARGAADTVLGVV